MTLVVGRYEGLFTWKSHFSRAKHTHTTTKYFFKAKKIMFYSICVVVYVDGYIAVYPKNEDWN
jgi:nicotinamide riboside transporter PnuC